MKIIVSPFTHEDIELLIKSLQYDLDEANKKIDVLDHRVFRLEAIRKRHRSMIDHLSKL